MTENSYSCRKIPKDHHILDDKCSGRVGGRENVLVSHSIYKNFTAYSYGYFISFGMISVTTTVRTVQTVQLLLAAMEDLIRVALEFPHPFENTARIRSNHVSSDVRDFLIYDYNL